jgi:hypothetical protein
VAPILPAMTENIVMRRISVFTTTMSAQLTAIVQADITVPRPEHAL